MKLYELPFESRFTIKDNLYDEGKVYTFYGVDGMFSKVTDEDGYLHHFAAWTEVELSKESEDEQR